MEELRRVQKDYGVAFANVLTVAKQRGVDCSTVEGWLYTLSLDCHAGAGDVDQLYAALRRAALAFRQLLEAVHKVGLTATA